MSHQLHCDIEACLPHLRAFAYLLARERELAEDLVQEAVVRALSHADQFVPGTDFKAWVMKILRNSYFNELRRRGRALQASAEAAQNVGSASGGQEERLSVREFERAFRTLSTSQRQALVLVGASGFSYEDAAKEAGCKVGTMKSRVSRARLMLQQLMDEDAGRAAAARAGLDRHAAEWLDSAPRRAQQQLSLDRH
jgi:RNA polymerase sigma-70 factor (ECF subfamily)